MTSYDYYGDNYCEEYQNYPPRQNFGKCYYQKYEGDVPPIRRKKKKKKRKYSTRRKAMIFGSNISDRIRRKFWGNSKSGRETITLNEELEPLKRNIQKSKKIKKQSKKKPKWRKKIKKFFTFVLCLSIFIVISYYVWKLKTELERTKSKLKLEEMEQNISNPNPVDQGLYSPRNDIKKKIHYDNQFEEMAYGIVGKMFGAVPKKIFKDHGLPTDTQSQLALLREQVDEGYEDEGEAIESYEMPN